MRGTIFTFLIVLFALSLSCTSVDVRLESKIGKRPPTVNPPTVVQPIKVVATEQADLPKRNLCHLDNEMDCPRPARGRAPVQACTAPKPVNTPAIAQFSVGGCWAASAEAITAAHGRKIAQCKAVNQVLGRADCCQRSGGEPPGPCQQNGWPYEIFNLNGFDWKWVKGHLTPETITGQLCQSGPFIFVLKLKGGGYHTFVVKEAEVTKGKMSLVVHDHSWIGSNPFGGGEPTDYEKLTYEDYKNGVWRGVQHDENAFAFVAIRPL